MAVPGIRQVPRQVDMDTERRIVTLAITSTSFLRGIFPFMREEFLQVPYARRAYGWARDYFRKYNEAPVGHVQDLYEIHKEKMDPDEASLLGGFLLDVSEKYEADGGPETVNVDFELDRATEFAKKADILARSRRAEALVQDGRVQDAEREMGGFRTLSRITSPWVNPNDPEEVKRAFRKSEEDRLVRFPGKLGMLLGWFKRGWLIAVQGPSKRGKCIAKGSIVSLPDGSLKRIEDVVRDRDRSTVTYDGISTSFGYVEEHFDNGVKPVYAVETRTGRRLEVTSEDRFLTDNGWRYVSDVSVGDFIAVPKRYPSMGKGGEDYRRLRLLAYLIADGCIGKGSPTFAKLEQAVRDDFDMCVRFIGDKVTWGERGGLICKSDQRCNGDCRKSKTVRWMEEIGLRRSKSESKEIPDFVFRLSLDCISAFLRTLFTCDGSISEGRFGGSISYSSASEVLIRQVMHLLLRFGVVSLLRRKVVQEKVYWELEIRDKENVSRFLDGVGFSFSKGEKADKVKRRLESVEDGKGFLDCLPNGITRKIALIVEEYIPSVGNGRKAWIRRNRWAERILHLARVGKGMGRRAAEVAYGVTKDDRIRGLLDLDILWDRVTSKGYIGEKHTYDLAIRDTHNFVANDIVVHNSWWLQEIRTLALMNRLRVVEVNLEMTREQLQMRYYKRISNAPDQEDGGGRYLYPVFDCQMNQLGTCSSRSRASSVALYEEGGRIPSYKDRPEGYVHCDCCRDQDGDDYVPATWWEEIEKEALTEDRTIRMVNAFGLMYGSNNYRMLCYPRFGATVGDLNRDLDILYETEGFAPDVIIPDYADIFGAENPKRDPRDRIDETWMALARMGTERHSLVATGTHSNLRRVEGKKRQRAGDVSEDTRKVNHLDLLAALDQTDSEKGRGIMRVGLVAYRHGKFNPNKQVTVLQNLDVGQVALDSEWDYGEREE